MSRDTLLEEFVRIVVDHHAQHGLVHKLVIAAHGEAFTGRIRILFCREGLDVHTAEQLQELRGKVRRIKLVSCEAASEHAQGNQFCAALAQETSAYVRASRDVQYIHADSRDRWEGRVVTYSPEGRIIEENEYPRDYIEDDCADATP